MSIRIFISSVQREFAKERALISDYIRYDAMLSRYFQVYRFEDTPAVNTKAPAVYLKEAAECDIYLGLIGEKYGYEDEEGISPTEREYNQASAQRRCRLVFVKECKDRHPKEKAFLAKVEKDVARRSFRAYKDLQIGVYEALVRYMQDNDILRDGRFDERLHASATLKDIDPDAVRLFIRNASDKRSFPLKENAFRAVIWRASHSPAPGLSQGAGSSRLLSQRQLDILKLIRKDAGVSRACLANQLNVHVKTIGRDLDALNAMGILKHTEPTRGGAWIISD